MQADPPTHQSDRPYARIRRGVYRDERGWIITGRDTIGRRFDIFTARRKPIAQRIARAAKLDAALDLAGLL